MQPAASGMSSENSTPLVCIPGDRSRVGEVAFGLVGSAEGGLLLFYNAERVRRHRFPAARTEYV